MEKRDRFPLLTGTRQDSRRSLAGFPALRDLLARGYRLALRDIDFDYYLREEETGRTAGPSLIGGQPWPRISSTT